MIADGRKVITVEKLKSLLDALPAAYRVAARTLADTGNLAIMDEKGAYVGFIDLAGETELLEEKKA